MGRIADYRRKKAGFDNLDNVHPYQSVGIGPGGNMPEYRITLLTNHRNPSCEWFYQAIVKHWDVIRATMKEIGAKDVNKTKGEAAKEAGDFLGLVGDLRAD